jgi:RNA polymerase primary sigma factor
MAQLSSTKKSKSGSSKTVGTTKKAAGRSVKTSRVIRTPIKSLARSGKTSTPLLKKSSTKAARTPLKQADKSAGKTGSMTAIQKKTLSKPIQKTSAQKVGVAKPQTAKKSSAPDLRKVVSKNVTPPTRGTSKSKAATPVSKTKSGAIEVDAVQPGVVTQVEPAVALVGKNGRALKAGAPLSEKAKAKERKAKEKAFLKDALATQQPGTAEELEARRTKLKNMIKLGKERGFLTYAEINDHLPDDVVDAEAIEGIISTFNDMGIAVYDQAPDAETLLMNDNAPVVSSDDDAEEEAEAALSTVDSEFGRTTDPVRMYMREMGSVELLTREGEIEIAKRIEEGLKHMIQAISACPTTISEILGMAEKIRREEMRIDEVVDGVIDPNAEEEAKFAAAAAAIEEEEFDDTVEDAEEGDDDGGAAVNAKALEDLKNAGLEKFDHIATQFEKMRRSFEREGYRSKGYNKAQ